MGSAAVSPVDFADVQGLLRFGFGKMPETRYLLVRIRNAGAARAWCAAAPVTTAETQSPPPEIALQVAFTAEGLRALGVPGHVVDAFAPEFLSGMAGDDSRSRRLGDTGANAPERWDWGGPGREPHLAVMIFAGHGKMDASARQICAGPWEQAFEQIAVLSTSDLDGHEPFGFVDGISQPELDWERRRNAAGDQLTYTNLVALGEFLLGYRNEYARYTGRPLLELEEEGAGVLTTAEDEPGKRDLGRNGTYLVLRQLAQDVRGFWQFLDAAAGAEGRRALGEAMVGRTIDGDPLVPAGGSQNDFTYDADPDAARCPFGAHIRRANPRSADMSRPPSNILSRTWTMLGGGRQSLREDLISSTRFHRILRRGREYGPGLTEQEALRPAPPDDPPRGLHFACLNANIGRQFEFVQNAWIASGHFNGLPDEPDPLLGNREGGCRFSLPRAGGSSRIVSGIPRFVTVRGGAYFFLPSLRALRYFSHAAARPPATNEARLGNPGTGPA